MYDLLIKGGRVIDPAQDIDDELDIGISGGKIAVLAADIPSEQSCIVKEAKGKIITPGLIDMHCHVFYGIKKGDAKPDLAGLMQGVTTVVDAGSSGQALFGGFTNYVIPSSRTNVFCFLSLASQGHTVRPELRDWAEVDIDATIDTIESNRDIIKGIKLRMVGNLMSTEGIKVWEAAKKAAKCVNLPIMIHVGDRENKVPAILTRQILAIMEPGDILSHIYTPRRGGCLDSDGTFYPEVKDAMNRGILFDVGHGMGNLSYDIARKGISQGILPTFISTDITQQRLAGPVYGLTVVMSKFLALGLDLEAIIRMTTINPARALGVENNIGSLKPGMNADVSVVELKSGVWELPDSEQKTIKMNDLLTPCYALKSGQVIESRPVGQPQPLR